MILWVNLSYTEANCSHILSFYHLCARLIPWLTEARRPRKQHHWYIPRQLLNLNLSGDYAQLAECIKMVIIRHEWWNIKLSLCQKVSNHNLLSCLFALCAQPLKGNPLTYLIGELYVMRQANSVNPPRQVAWFDRAPCLHVNKVFKEPRDQWCLYIY